MKKVLAGLLVISAFLVSCAPVSSSEDPSSTRDTDQPSTIEVEQRTPLELYFLEMTSGYVGDGAYLKLGDYEVIIDAGDKTDGAFIHEFLGRHNTDGTIELVIGTHPHADHLGGIPTALKDYKVGTILDYGTDDSCRGYGPWRSQQIDKGAHWIKYFDAIYEQNGEKNIYTLAGDLTLFVLNNGNVDRSGNYAYEGNGLSVCVMFRYFDFTFLTCGDNEGNGEMYLTKHCSYLPKDGVSFFKADHHGSTSRGKKNINDYETNCQPFLDRIAPKTIAISASRDCLDKNAKPWRFDPALNKTAVDGHPYNKAVKRMQSTRYLKETLNVYWNMYAGTMKFVSYGEDIPLSMEGEGPTLGYYANENDTEIVSGENNKRYCETVVYKAREKKWGSMTPAV